MAYTNKAQLEEARALFYSWRLMDAYNILRRFFARLPFQPQKEHAEYIGMFARILAELGKTRELQFHMSELERLHRKTRHPYITYQLAYVYRYVPDAKLKESKEFLEEIIRNPEAKDFHVRAKMMLADWYDFTEENTAACKLIIDSIQEPPDRDVRNLLEVWRAKIARDMGNFDAADSRLCELLARLQLPQDWYAIASAKVILSRSYIRQKRYEDAARIVMELRTTFSGKNFRSIEIQIADLDKDLRKTPSLGTLVFRPGEEWSVLKYSRRTLRIRGRSFSERLLVLLLKRQFAPTDQIVKDLYSRKSNGRRDDKVVQGHVQTVRKQLKKLGLPPEALIKEARGYRLVPFVEIQEAP